MRPYTLSELQELEAESIHIMREVAAEFERPVLLYSVGKDSSCLVRLAQKAFHPGPIPFPLLHVDTGYKFSAMVSFRDTFVASIGAQLKVHYSRGTGPDPANPFDLGTQRCCGLLKTEGLLRALREGRFDAAIGGARRDEEKSRAKERVYSFRDRHGQWDPKRQRPELWNLYNGLHRSDEHIRVFPLSNWTELDVWRYIAQEEIPVVPLYFAQKRSMIEIDGQLFMPGSGHPGAVQEVMCRFRSLGCAPCTGAVRSTALSVVEIIAELEAVRDSERAQRVIDHDSDGSMETKKREGYF